MLVPMNTTEFVQALSTILLKPSYLTKQNSNVVACCCNVGIGLSQGIHANGKGCRVLSQCS